MKRYKSNNGSNLIIPSLSNINIKKENNINIISTTNSNITKKKLSERYNFSNDNIHWKHLKSLNENNLYISNIPSLQEMKNSVEEYYKKNELNNKIPKAFVSQINKNTVRIDFPNEKILNGYKSYISFLKYENPVYKNIIIKKDNLYKTIKKIRLNNSNVNVLNNTENKEKKIIVKNIIKLYEHNRSKYRKDNASFSLLNLRKSNDNDKLIINYYKNQDYLRNSSPYLSEEEKRIMSERESRKKFMTPNGFCVSVGKYSCPPKYISNYVQMTPSENPSTYRFRQVNKLKWITKKGFINA